ncbi:MAG: cupin [Alphaproteobacteria bacterium]|nr:MAG: cupin [Alphaproteobacteria bacterium]
MSRLTIYPDQHPEDVTLETTDGAVITKELNDIGVRFERWKTQSPLAADADNDAVMDAYADDIQRLKDESGYQSVDVIRLTADHPQKTELREKFLSEHTHSEDEVRFFVEGAGIFYLRVEGRVYMTLCERGDLISVPTDTRHWFDMGAEPNLTCIRLFTSKDGWVADYTGDGIADKFPKFEQKASAA